MSQGSTRKVPPFVHLHCHSHFSLLDGAGRLDQMIQAVKDRGMNSLALTDHGNLYGALEFYQKARAGGINPILGYEAYVAPGHRRSREGGSMKEAAYHLTLLAQNRTGFRNLVKLASRAFLEGFYYKPRIDRELLEQFNEGIICLSGCVSGEFSSAIIRGSEPDLNRAIEVAQWFHKVFGDRYFVEVQNNGLEIQRLAMEGAFEVANRVGLPVVATSDAHYVNREDADAQDVLLCINTGKFRTDSNRMRMEGSEFFLRSPEEMLEHFAGHEDVLARSQEIADSVDIDLELGKHRHFPVFQLPEGRTSSDYLRELCLQGLTERYQNAPERWVDGTIGGTLHPDVIARLDRELGCIERLGFPNYFLIVWDFVNYAKEAGIQATARGSGVGALVAYALYLSHVCPLRYDLLFERFLDDSRKEPPDIDIDFEKERRGEVIEYVKRKYGSENVAQIGTFGTLAARAAVRDVGRVQGVSLVKVDSIVAMVPDQLGISLDEALQQSDELKRAYDADPEVREVLDFARKIEGLARNVGTHAAAVVIADQPLEEYVPLQRVPGKDEVITQWAMNDVEAAGLLKMDFLGLRNLTMISRSVQLIERNRGQRLDPYTLPLTDTATYALLCRGETKGVFQLESGGIRDLLQRMKPDGFHDIIATNALYRPGPLKGGMVDDYIDIKHGRKQPSYAHPVMREVLEETYGIMVYQEQVMRILNGLGDIALPDAYTCIKAISKKKLDKIAKFRQEFIKGAGDKGVARKEAESLFGLIEQFAGYGFNKSHSTAYALIAYITAYLKAHYPTEFMAALLSSDVDGRNFKRKDPLVEHIEDCRRMNITVLPPDVNRSDADFNVDGDVILFALSAIKGCGQAACESLVAERRANGPYRDLYDLCERLDAATVGRGVLESLIKAGAFDSLGGHRAQLIHALDKALQAGSQAQADRRSGQKNLFGDDEATESAVQSLPDVPPWEAKEQLACEKEVLGFFLTSHPLSEHETTLSSFCTHRTNELADLSNKAEVLVGGMISSLKLSNTKRPRPGSTVTRYAMFDLEDMDGLVRCIVWPEEFANCQELVQHDAMVAARGTIDKRPGSDEVNLVVQELYPITELEQRFTKRVMIRLYEDEHGATGLESLFQILRGYPGEIPVDLFLCLADGAKALLRSDKVKVQLDPELRRRVEDLLGQGHLRFLGGPNGGNRRRPARERPNVADHRNGSRGSPSEQRLASRE